VERGAAVAVTREKGKKYGVEKYLGVRYREHETRKHGVNFDRYFFIRYKVKEMDEDGGVKWRDKEEAVGWASDGMTAEKAHKILSTIRESIRSGVGPQSMADQRRINEEKEKEKVAARRDEEREQTTFDEFWKNEYLPSAEAAKTDQTMYGEKGLYANWIRPALGEVPLRKIDVAKVEVLANAAKKAGKSAATVRYILKIVSQVWNKAALRDLVQGECPTRRVKKPQADNRRERFLTEDEAGRLLAALAERSMDMHDIALLSLFCGLRAGEIHALKWGDVDLHNGIISINDTKNKINRKAFITKEVLQMIERRRQNQAKSELVFPGAKGKPRQWVSDTFSRTVDALGFNDTGEYTRDENGRSVAAKITDARQKVVFHTLRHTFASWLVKKGTPLYTVAELLGHTTLIMTRRYSHLAPDTLRRAALSLQGQLEQAPSSVMQFPKARTI
jgi:integrase